jgi:hypothetical protein
MKKQTTFKMYYEWEFDGDPLRSHYLIDAEDLEGAIDLFNSCYKRDNEILVNIEPQPQWEKDELKKIKEERKKYHQNRLKNKGVA